MNFIHPSLIHIGERTRELIPDHVSELKLDILNLGLLQPIVLGDRGENPPLVDGLHRIHALKAIFDDQGVVMFDGEVLPPYAIPFVRFSDLDPARLLEAEIAANIWRRELSWPERVAALAKLHQLQLKENPNATFSTTAAKLAGASGRSESSTRQAISRAVVLADAMEENPDLASAKSEAEAFSRVRSDVSRLGASLLAGGFTSTHSRHSLLEGSLVEILPTLQDESIDLILTDPPYGVGAHTWASKFKDAPHDYEDTLENALRLYEAIFSEGFRIGKPRAVMFTFCAIQYWAVLRELADKHGWSVWPRPVIWRKSSEGIPPWGSHGFTYCYETLLFASKGGRGLKDTMPDVIEGIYKVRHREHGAAKPIPLYVKLIESVCMPGDTVIDPCCGSGTIFPAATLTKTIATGIELNPHFIGLSQESLRQTELELNENEPVPAIDEDF